MINFSYINTHRGPLACISKIDIDDNDNNDKGEGGGEVQEHIANRESEQSMDPPLCGKGCGFYGSASTHNLCSQCYKKWIKESSSSPAAVAAFPQGLVCRTRTAQDFLVNSSSVGSDHQDTACSSEKEAGPPPSNRCVSCKKRVGILGFRCRCGQVYCGKHRYPEEHKCSVDLKAAGREILKEQNPVVKGDKLKNRL